MAKIDWDYARKADRWTLEEFCEFIHPNDPSAQAKLNQLARRAMGAEKLSFTPVHHGVRFLAGTPEWKKYIIYLIPREALAWAQGKGVTIPPELAGIAPPAAERPQADLTPLKRQDETPAERSARLRARHQELTAAGDPHPTKTLAEEEGITTRRVLQVMKTSRRPR